MIKNLVQKYREATNALILLDYDGTLVNHTSLPGQAKPPEKLLNLLSKLILNPKTDVIIISGRMHHELEIFFGHIQIDIVAEHGAMFKKNGKWEIRVKDCVEWRSVILPIMQRITNGCPNSFVEEKNFAISWHYRNADTGYTHSRTLIRLMEKIAAWYNLKILDGNKVIEVMSKEIGKGKAGKSLVEQKDYDYILSLGDDKTDEELFHFFLHNKNAATIKVGAGSTFAKYKLENVNNVISFLEELSL